MGPQFHEGKHIDLYVSHKPNSNSEEKILLCKWVSIFDAKLLKCLEAKQYKSKKKISNWISIFYVH